MVAEAAVDGKGGVVELTRVQIWLDMVLPPALYFF